MGVQLRVVLLREAVMKFNFETHNEKTRWPWIVLSLAGAAIVAFLVAYPEEATSFLRDGKELFASKESGKRGHDSKNSMCNGIFWSCTASPTVVQGTPPEQRSEPPVVAARKETPEPSASTVVQQSPKDELRSGKSMSFASGEKKLMGLRPNNALAQSNTPTYRWIGPIDELSLLGIDRFKPSIGLCALKMYLSCYMPEGFGREAIVRETDD